MPETTPPLDAPQESVILTVDAKGVPRVIGDVTGGLTPGTGGRLRTVEYTCVGDALAEAVEGSGGRDA